MNEAESPVGIFKRGPIVESPWLGIALAILVGVVVFVLIWKMRKTFGLKE